MTVRQNDMVLALMRRRPEGITPMDALINIGCFRLAARVADLKAEGHDIESCLVKVTVPGGRKARVARYRLVEV